MAHLVTILQKYVQPTIAIAPRHTPAPYVNNTDDRDGAVRLKGVRGMSDSPRTPSIHGQLSTLLGRQVKQLRKTDTVPPRISIYVVIAAVTGMDGNHAGKAYRDLVVDYPEVHSIGVNFKFPGRGQRNTPIADVRGIVEIIMLLPGHTAAT